MTQQKCSAVYLGRSVTQGSVTPGFLSALIISLQAHKHTGDHTCLLEFSSEGLGVQMVKNDEGFESDGGDSDGSVSTQKEDEFFPLRELVFCHTDGNVVVWVVRSGGDGLDAHVFECSTAEHARGLYQVFNDVSKKVKFERYCRSRPLASSGATVVISLAKEMSPATLPRPYSRSLPRDGPSVKCDPPRWSLVHHTDDTGLTYLEIQNGDGHERQRERPTLNRNPHKKGPAPIPPPRKHPNNPKLILVPLKSEESKRSMYPKEPHFVRGNFVRVSLVQAVNFEHTGFNRVSRGRSSVQVHPRRSVRRSQWGDEPLGKKYMSNLSNKLREMVLHRRFKMPTLKADQVKSVMKKTTAKTPENKKVTFNAFATVQVMK